jgi:hypothetical protein
MWEHGERREERKKIENSQLLSMRESNVGRSIEGRNLN